MTTKHPSKACLHFLAASISIFLGSMATLCLEGNPAEAADKPVMSAVIDSLGPVMDTVPESIPVFDSTTSLDEYLAVAMKRNPGLRSAYNKWIADLKKSDYVGSLPDPMFSYTYFVENVETRVGPQQQRFGLRQSFPWFGTLGARKDVAFAKSEASYEHFRAAKFELFFNVKAAFYDYYFLGQDLLITRENLDLLKFWESVAQSKYKVGLKGHPDVIKAQVELGKLEDHLRTIQERKTPKAARLRALLNLPDSVELPIPTSISVIESSFTEDSVINLIKRQNPNIQALGRIVESERASQRLAKKLTLPSFSIGVDYIQTGEAVNPGMAESGKDPWMIGASISLPIWFGKNSARKKEAEARRQQAEYNLQDTENTLVAVTEQLLFEYSDALRKTRLYRDGLVPKAEQSLNTSYAAYQAGEMDFLNVLDAQRQLLDFELTVVREKTRLATKRAQLEMLSGKDLTAYMQQ